MISADIGENILDGVVNEGEFSGAGLSK